MELRCDCGAKTIVKIHKDGYEVVRFICGTCKYKNWLKFHNEEVRITMSNGDYFYVKKAYNVRRRA